MSEKGGKKCPKNGWAAKWGMRVGHSVVAIRDETRQYKVRYIVLQTPKRDNVEGQPMGFPGGVEIAEAEILL